jgi:Cysteine-rich CPXCG
MVNSMKSRRKHLAKSVSDNCPVEAGFQCAGCGEWNSTTVDESAGRRQTYVEDCQTCCKPNLLQVEYDTASREYLIAAALE